ncbi:hypothetical protein V2A60_010420 [Cordyceps javanica]|uniref:Integral membrane protein n=1 Tax=Cordyceps javanica TaxID=43265 RepID=A0A545VJP8_9HYPO|nr:integral membrane protein [Cordyceps javanica]TQW01954.1 integral membrane protein [Cordyceps javanica]
MAANPQQTPLTTIVPFNDRSKLPACAVSCKALYDANANCVPPIIPSGPVSNYEACFCINQNVIALSTATDAVCNDVCSAEQGGQSSVAKWFGSLCHVTATGGTTKTATTTKGATSGSTGSGSSGNKSGDWISNHWQWVIMLVVLIVVIAGVWIGACIWRRRYLRRKDRQTSLGQKQSGSASRPSWGPTTMPTSDSGAPMNYSGGAEAAYPKFESTEKPPKQKKKWTVTSRT